MHGPAVRLWQVAWNTMDNALPDATWILILSEPDDAWL